MTTLIAPDPPGPAAPTADSIVALQIENDRLRRAVEELEVLNELAREIGASYDLDQVMRTVVHRAVQAVQAEQGVITLIDGSSDGNHHTLVRTMATSGRAEPFHPDRVLLGWMMQHRLPLQIDDTTGELRFPGLTWSKNIRSLLAVPLLVRSRLVGMLTVQNKRPEAKFTGDDVRLISIMASQSAQVIENARLFQDEQALRRVEEEVRLALRIQTNLLPAGPPAIPGYEITGHSRPARTVGGDYYDFLQPRPGRFGICVADASGKGLPAALLMANVQATLRGQIAWSDSVAACVAFTNRLLYRSIGRGSFVTMFYAELDPVHNILEYVNAGHNHPLIVRLGSEPEWIAGGDLALGLKEDVMYQRRSIRIEPGSLVVIYTDGLTEARNERGDLFGEDRLADLASRCAGETAGGFVRKIEEAVRTFTGTAGPSDDLTVVCLKNSITPPAIGCIRPDGF